MRANAIIWALDENPNLAGTTLACRNTAAHKHRSGTTYHLHPSFTHLKEQQ